MYLPTCLNFGTQRHKDIYKLLNVVTKYPKAMVKYIIHH